MRSTLTRSMSIVILVVCSFIITGCGYARYITIETIWASEVNVPDRIITVAIVSIDIPGKPNIGAQMRDELKAKLHESGRFEILECDHISKVKPSDILDLPEQHNEEYEFLLNPSLEKADAVIVIDVSDCSYELTEEEREVPYTVTHHHRGVIWTGRRNILHTSNTYETRMRMSTFQSIIGCLSCHVSLFDIKQCKFISIQPYVKAKSWGPYSEATPPSEGSFIRQIADKFVEDFSRKITPQKTKKRYAFMKNNSPLIKSGCNSAVCGRFEEAIEFFKNGASENPENVGWFFNIGLSL